MYFAYWMVLAAAFLPYACAAYAKGGGKADNNAPRLYAETLTGGRRRADWAQANHFESFPTFAAGVIIASVTGAPHNIVNALAAIYVAIRILYTFAYITDRATVRSILFSLGALCILGLFLAAGFA